jgi:hypothetical protein
MLRWAADEAGLAACRTSSPDHADCRRRRRGPRTGSTLSERRETTTETRDRQARHRWPLSNVPMPGQKRKRRIPTRKAGNYLAFLHVGKTLILNDSF